MTLAKLAIDTGYKFAAVYALVHKQGIAQVAPVKGMARVQPRDASVGTDLRRCHGEWPQTLTRRAALDGSDGHLQGRNLSPPADRKTVIARRARPCGHDPPARLCGQRMAETAGGRAAGHDPRQARLCPAGLAENARAQRGPRHPGYARKAAWILGADRFDERIRRQLEKQAGVETVAATPNADPKKPTAQQAGEVTTPRRRA